MHINGPSQLKAVIVTDVVELEVSNFGRHYLAAARTETSFPLLRQISDFGPRETSKTGKRLRLLEWRESLTPEKLSVECHGPEKLMCSVDSLRLTHEWIQTYRWMNTSAVAEGYDRWPFCYIGLWHC
eukprot:g14739.t1